MKNDTTNLEQIAQVIREKFTSTTNSFNSGLWKFVGTQGNMIDLKDFIDKVNETDDITLRNNQNLTTDELNTSNIDKRLQNIDEHIVELGDLFKEMRFEPVTNNTHSNVKIQPNPIKESIVSGKKVDKSKIFSTLYEETKETTKQTTSSWVKQGIKNLNSPLLEGAIEKLYNTTKAFMRKDESDNLPNSEVSNDNQTKPKKKAPKAETSTSSSESSENNSVTTTQSTFKTSVNEQLNSVMNKTEDNEDDNRNVKQLETIEKIERDTTQYHVESSKLLSKIEHNTRLNNTLQKGGLIDDGLDILDRFKRKGKANNLPNIDTPNKPGKLDKIKGLGTRVAGGAGTLASSLSLPLLAAGASALTFGGTGAMSAYKALKGEDASNWISNSVDSVIQKISGDKNTSLGSTIYDMLNKSEQSKSEVMNSMVMKPTSNSDVSNTSTHTTNNSTMNIKPEKSLNVTPVPDRNIDELEHSLKVYEKQSKEQPPVVINNTTQQQSQAPMPERGQDVVPVITRGQYNPLTSISDSMLKTSL